MSAIDEPAVDRTAHHTEGGLEFSEAPYPWVSLPDWVKCFLTLGYLWPSGSVARRLCIVSTPCESAAPGLIALGAMIRRLEAPQANDGAAHFARLQALTAAGPTSVILRHRSRPGLFEVARREGDRVWLSRQGKTDAALFLVLPANASDWAFDDEPFLTALHGEQLRHASLYNALGLNGAGIRPENLRSTDSAVVLAGKARGRLATKEALQAVAFRSGDSEACVSELLSVHGWHGGAVSRVRYFNPLGESRFDRGGSPPKLVVAWGPRTFEAARAARECEAADLIGVVPRTSDFEQLEGLAHSIDALSQWYEPDRSFGGQVPTRDGIEIRVMRRRA